MKRENYSLNDFADLAKAEFAVQGSVVFEKYSAINAFFDCLFENALAYFFITDYQRMSFTFLSKSVKNVLGYSHDFFLRKGFEYLFNSIHIEDRVRLKQIHARMFDYFFRAKVSERKDLKFTINYRVRRNDDKYIMIQQEVTFTDITIDGYPLADFSTCTDISAYKNDNSLKLIVYKKLGNIYNEVYEFTINEQVDLLTQRQIEILNLLSKGFTTCQIAQKLFLSEETVKIHRKNILHRTGAKNSIQAVNILLSNELVHTRA